MNRMAHTHKAMTTLLGAGLLLLVGFAFAGQASAQATCTPPFEGLVGWWPGDGDANDMVGANHGTLVNGVTFATAMLGQAFSFDGVNDFVDVGSVVSVKGQAQRTIDAWIRVNAFGSKSEPILTESIGGRLGQNVDLPVRLVFAVGSAGNVALGGRHSATDPTPFQLFANSEPGVIAPGQFFHVAAVYDGVGGAHKVYVNGVDVTVSTVPGGPFPNTDPTVGLRIGHDTTDPFNGVIDEVKIFNRALAADEVQAIFNAGSGGKCVSLSFATLWIGLKNSDDQGTQFDLRTEVYINDTLTAVGETRCITGVTRNPSKAKEVSVEFGPLSEDGLAAGDELFLKVLTRIGTNPDGTKCAGPGGSHSNAVGLRLYYDATNRPSRFGMEIIPDPLTDFFLHTTETDFFDDAPPTATSAKVKDSPAVNFAGGNPWREIGTWSMTLP